MKKIVEKILRIIDRLLVPKVKRPILCLDFDGVIHSYTSGWQGPRTIPDAPVQGAILFLREFLEKFCDYPEQWGCMVPPGKWELHIYSSRSRYLFARSAMKKWLVANGLEREWVQILKFPTRKPPAVLTIDDRAICFDGEFPPIPGILAFQPWTKGQV